MSDASSQCLVESTVGLDLVPLTARQQATLVGVLVVVLPLQLHLMNHSRGMDG